MASAASSLIRNTFRGALDSFAKPGRRCPRGARPVLAIPAEAFLRLLTGRLGEARTPAGVTLTGKASLASLRRLFPGF